ncbi:MAG: IclR family transcriptional regulator [Roseiflexaceae bacterium]
MLRSAVSSQNPATDPAKIRAISVSVVWPLLDNYAHPAYNLVLSKSLSHYESMNQQNTRERHIQSLNRAFDILAAIQQAEGEGLGLKDICAATGLHMSTAHHLTTTMVARGYLDQEPRSRRYNLGPMLLQLGAAALDSMDLHTVARPVARELCDRTEENVYVTILRGWTLITLIAIPSPHPIRVVWPPRQEPSLHAAASGKCLLAYQMGDEIERYLNEVPLRPFTQNTITDANRLKAELATIRAEGVVYDREEYVQDLACIAAPVFNDRSEIAAALSIAYPAWRGGADKVPQWITSVLACAEQLSTRLGRRSPATNGHRPGDRATVSK